MQSTSGVNSEHLHLLIAMLVAIQFILFAVVLYIYTSWLQKKAWFADQVSRGGALVEIISNPYFICYAYLAYMHLSADWVYSASSTFGLYDPNITAFTTEINQTYIETTRPKGLCIAVRDRDCKFEACKGGSCNSLLLTECMDKWSDPCGTMEIHYMIRILVLLSPPCVVLALVISAIHTWKHLRYGKPWKKNSLFFLHHYALEIILLVPVFGFFALRSVALTVHLLEGRLPTSEPSLNKDLLIGGNGSENSWEAYIEHVERLYDLNFTVANMYEARALFKLTSVMMEYIHLLQDRRGLLSHSCRRCSIKCPACHAENHQTISHTLMVPIKMMTMLGVQIFVWTNFIWCLYCVGSEQVREMSPTFWQQINSKMRQLGSVDASVTGFTLCTSIIAILNLFIFEHDFTDALGGFRPKLKFWSGRLLVSLAFIQRCAINGIPLLIPQFYLLHYQKQLVYACLICIEMLPVVLLQLVAWDADTLEDISFLCQSSQITRNSQQIEFTVSSRSHSMLLSIEQNLKNDKTFWRSASVVLLSDDKPANIASDDGSVVEVKNLS